MSDLVPESYVPNPSFSTNLQVSVMSDLNVIGQFPARRVRAAAWNVPLPLQACAAGPPGDMFHCPSKYARPTSSSGTVATAVAHAHCHRLCQLSVDSLENNTR